MRYWMVCLLVLVALIGGRAFAGEARTSTGAVQLGSVIKFVYGFSERHDETKSPGREDFTTALCDVSINGRVSDDVHYMVELSASFNQQLDQGEFNGQPNPFDVGEFGVRQAYISFPELIPYSNIKLGTFFPPVTNYMARPLHDLDMILYPLLNNASRMNTGMFGNRPAERDFSLWQQTGANITVNLPFMIKLDAGVWNGFMPDQETNFNENPAKATSLVFTFEPGDKISMSLAYWGEEFQQEYPGKASGAKRNLTMWYIYASYRTDVLNLTADYSQGIIPEFLLNTNDEFKNLTWDAYQVTASYWIKPRFEMLARYEYINPNSRDSVQLPESRYDESAWTTLGLNIRVAERAELSMNYIWRNELAWTVDEGDPGQEPDLPGYNPKYSAQKNDLFLLQFMAWH